PRALRAARDRTVGSSAGWPPGTAEDVSLGEGESLAAGALGLPAGIAGVEGPAGRGGGPGCGAGGGVSVLWPGAGVCAPGALPAVGRVRRDGGGRAVAATSPSPGRGLGRGWVRLVGGLGCRRRALVGPGRARVPRGGVRFPRGRRGGTVPGRRTPLLRGGGTWRLRAGRARLLGPWARRRRARRLRGVTVRGR